MVPSSGFAWVQQSSNLGRHCHRPEKHVHQPLQCSASPQALILHLEPWQKLLLPFQPTVPIAVFSPSLLLPTDVLKREWWSLGKGRGKEAKEDGKEEEGS